MADDQNSEHQAFFGLRLKDDGENWSQFTYGDDLERLKEWGAEENKSDPDEGADQAEDGSDDSEVSGGSDEGNVLAGLMYRTLDSGLALSELTISSSAVKNLFSSIISRAEVVDPIKESCPVVFENGAIKIYGISADRLTKVREQHRRLVRMDRGFDLLPSAVLLTIVATFDSLTVEIVRAVLGLKPDRLNDSEKTIAISDILSMNSFDDVKSKILDDEIYQYSRGSHDDQVKYIEKNFGIQIAKSWKRWPDFIEIFERRNLVAHGEKKFTKRYVEICKKHGHKGSDKILGDDIEITTQYLAQSIDVLVEFCIILIFSIWRKQLPTEESEVFDLLNDVSYRLISDERYRVPIRVIEYALSLKGTKITEATRLMLIVNLASAHRHRKDKDQANKTLDGVDWSAASDNYRLCVAAIREDLPELIKLMEPTSSSGKVKKDDFREWPVFSFVRETAEFQAEFERIYGEQLFDPSTEATTLPEKKKGEPEINNGDETVH